MLFMYDRTNNELAQGPSISPEHNLRANFTTTHVAFVPTSSNVQTIPTQTIQQSRSGDQGDKSHTLFDEYCQMQAELAYYKALNQHQGIESVLSFRQSRKRRDLDDNTPEHVYQKVKLTPKDKLVDENVDFYIGKKRGFGRNRADDIRE